MTIGCSPRLRHWAPIRRLYGSMVCQHLKAQTTRALQRKNNSACAMRLWVGPYCMSFYPWMWSWAVQDKSTNCGATFCPITALRVTEAEQELAAGNSDVEAVLPEEHGWPSAISFYPGNLTRRRGKLITCRMIFTHDQVFQGWRLEWPYLLCLWLASIRCLCWLGSGMRCYCWLG